MSIDTIKEVEVIQGKGSIYFYLDVRARSLDRSCPTSLLNGPDGLTGDPNYDRAVWPLLLAAKSTGTYWGFDYEGYRQLLAYFAQPAQGAGDRSAEIDQMTAARIVDAVRAERDLEPMIKGGWLRVESYVSPEGKIGVYFVSDKLAARAVAARGARTTPVTSVTVPVPARPATVSSGTCRSGRPNHSLVAEPRNKPIF